MNLSKFKLGHSISKYLIVAIAVVCSFVGCTDFDQSFGLDYSSSSQELSLQTLNGYDGFETSLYRSDSIRVTNVGLVVLGAEKIPGFGERRAGFFTEFIPIRELNEDDDDDWDENYPFGYAPILDSLVLTFTVVEFSGDTTYSQKFEVYEAFDKTFLESSLDSVYFSDFDMSQLALSDEPIFTFTFPDPDREIYTDTGVVRLFPEYTEDGVNKAQSFLDRLLLLDETADNDIYDEDERELFLEKFKGIYIVPVSEIPDPSATATEIESTGAVYSLYTEGSGLGFYARSVYERDPTIIKDTTIMPFSFRNFDSYDLDDDYYGFSVNKIEYTSDLKSEDESATIKVEGMGGVASRITISKDLFLELDQVLAEQTDSNGDLFNTIFMNQARLFIYIPQEAGGNYDSSKLQPLVVTPWLDEMPERLGMYTRYVDFYEDEDDHDDNISALSGIEDYYYEYEVAYDAILKYNGYLNRSLGCYEMWISAQLQAAWNSYLEVKEAVGGDSSKINWDDVEDRSFIIAPLADNLFSVRYTSLQGMPDGVNNAPMKLDLTYTLVK